MLENYDKKYGAIASRKQNVVIDLARGPISYSTLKSITYKKMFDNTCQYKVTEYEAKEKKKKGKESFPV